MHVRQKTPALFAGVFYDGCLLDQAGIILAKEFFKKDIPPGGELSTASR